MRRVIRIKPEDLEWAAKMTPQARLELANTAFKLFHELHRPFAVPFTRSFATLEEFFRFQREHDLFGRPIPRDSDRQI
jgi:hypothetical protein